MSDLTFTPGQFYKTRDGRKAKCLYNEPEAGPNVRLCFLIDGSICHNYADGKFGGHASDHDIISEWHEPRKLTVWVQMFRFGEKACFCTHESRPLHCANTLAIRKITITEGEFDE